jgi:hypothetical protein
MSETARERAIRRNAEAGGAPRRKQPKPPPEPTPEEKILNYIGEQPGSTSAEIIKALDLNPTLVWTVIARLAEGTKIRRDGRGWSLVPPFRFLPSRTTTVANLAAGRGDVIKIGKRLVVVTQVEWRGEAWAVEHLDLVDKGRALTNANSVVTWFGPTAAPEPVARWLGNLEPGSTGLLEKADPSDDSDTNQDPQTPIYQREANMAKTVVRRGSKPAATNKPAAKAKPAAAKPKPAAEQATTTRKANVDYAAKVPMMVEHLNGGGTMNQLKAKLGVSTGGAIREALFRAGYNSKGQPHGEEAGSIDATKAAGKKQLAKLRADGAPWYRLEFLSGLGETAVKEIVEAAGAPTGRVYTQSEKPAKPAATNGDGATAKPAAKPRAGSGKKVTRRATAANPSS